MCILIGANTDSDVCERYYLINLQSLENMHMYTAKDLFEHFFARVLIE